MKSTLYLAYLDAGSASMLLAALAGGAAGLRLLLKSQWDKLRGSGKHEDESDSPKAESDSVRSAEVDASGTS